MIPIGGGYYPIKIKNNSLACGSRGTLYSFFANNEYIRAMMHGKIATLGFIGGNLRFNRNGKHNSPESQMEFQSLQFLRKLRSE